MAIETLEHSKHIRTKWRDLKPFTNLTEIYVICKVHGNAGSDDFNFLKNSRFLEFMSQIDKSEDLSNELHPISPMSVNIEFFASL